MGIEKYPARAHALKVVKELYKLLPEPDKDKNHIILLQAPPSECRHDTDRELPYHQEANFTYLTGYPHPSAAVFIRIHYRDSNPTIRHELYVPIARPEETMWSVAPPSLEEANAAFDSDIIIEWDGLEGMFRAEAREEKGYTLHTLPLTKEFPALPDFVQEAIRSKGIKADNKTHTIEHNSDLLRTAIQIARLTKDEYEIDLIREANRISSGAHETLMKELGKFAKRRAEGKVDAGERTGKEGLEQWEVEGEGDAEALFIAACRRQGSQPAYLPICASGKRAATLHYVCNDRIFPHLAEPRSNGDKSFQRRLARGCCSAEDHQGYKAGTPIGEYHSDGFEPQVLLVDAGGEWQNYASDITRTIPVGNGGKFTKEAGEIYELVLRMQKECEQMVKPGVHWDTLHLHSHKTLIDGFLKLGIFKSGSSPADILASGVTLAFYPHGLGHSLGLDVHDSLQYLRTTHVDIPKESKPDKLFMYLRIRQPLQAGMVLTVEPGCYFPQQLMEEHGAFTSDFVDQEVLKRYIPLGGVRIEDVVLVTGSGVENLTTVPRDRHIIEQLCAGTS